RGLLEARRPPRNAPAWPLLGLAPLSRPPLRHVPAVDSVLRRRGRHLRHFLPREERTENPPCQVLRRRPPAWPPPRVRAFFWWRCWRWGFRRGCPPSCPRTATSRPWPTSWPRRRNRATWC